LSDLHSNHLKWNFLSMTVPLIQEVKSCQQVRRWRWIVWTKIGLEILYLHILSKKCIGSAYVLNGGSHLVGSVHFPPNDEKEPVEE
jgi:hypothetical protein